MTDPRPPASEESTLRRDSYGEFEDYPLTRTEYISAMVHFYRGEPSHSDAWRARLDPTTNWAVVTAGAMLSFSFNGPEHSHVTLLLALVVITIFLGFEARRFRYFDAWRARVRLFEENFWIPMFRRNLVSPKAQWREAMARDLDQPTFKLPFPESGRDPPPVQLPVDLTGRAPRLGGEAEHPPRAGPRRRGGRAADGDRSDPWCRGARGGLGRSRAPRVDGAPRGARVVGRRGPRAGEGDRRVADVTARRTERDGAAGGRDGAA
ncbi:MAG: DUF2270 domain-containing protein, partial [Gemmatimonadota bacterium]